MKTGIYQHYKGGEFLVLGLATLEENLEEAVIYQHLSDDYSLWIRAKKLFEEQVEISEYSYRGPRFVYKAPWTPLDAQNHPKALSPFPPSKSTD